MPKPGSIQQRTIPSGTVLRGGSDRAFSLADDAVADEAVADVEPSGKPELVAGSTGVRQVTAGITTRRTIAPGITSQRNTPPGASSERG